MPGRIGAWSFPHWSLVRNQELEISNSVCVVFLGCPKNQVDSEHVLGSLTQAGYNLTTDPKSADLIVITTCAFLQSAVRESEAAIQEGLKLKRASPSNPEADADATKARKTRNGQGEPPMNTDTRADVSEKTICVHPCPSVVGRSPRPASCFRSSSCRDSDSRKVVVAGCLVERYGENLKRRFPAVDLWVPLRDMPGIASLIASSREPQTKHGVTLSKRSASKGLSEETPRLRSGRQPRLSAICNRSSASSFIPHPSSFPRVLSTPRHFAYLKIADGCDNRCSYCTIPSIRGPFRSRPLPDIITEARNLTLAGVKELILVAQDTTLYGTDFQTGIHHQGARTPSRKRSKPAESVSCLRGSTPVSVSAPGQARLAELLGELSRIDGIRWLRLMYTHPAHVTEDVIDQFASNPKLCRYIDLPIQHVADHLLANMNRHYTRQDVELLLESLRAIPDVHIRTTIIVGLPGETTRDFEELLAFVRSAKFDRLSCYAYSPEPGTSAARLPGQVSPAVKKERVRRLMLTQAAISRANLKKLVGRKLTVLVDTRTDNRQGCQVPDSESLTGNWQLETGNSRCVGRTEWDAPEIDGVVKLTGRSVHPGTFVCALVTGSSTHDITATLV